jgi:hypothetical protein
MINPDKEPNDKDDNSMNEEIKKKEAEYHRAIEDGQEFSVLKEIRQCLDEMNKKNRNKKESNKDNPDDN